MKTAIIRRGAALDKQLLAATYRLKGVVQLEVDVIIGRSRLLVVPPQIPIDSAVIARVRGAERRFGARLVIVCEGALMSEACSKSRQLQPYLGVGVICSTSKEMTANILIEVERSCNSSEKIDATKAYIDQLCEPSPPTLKSVSSMLQSGMQSISTTDAALITQSAGCVGRHARETV